MSIERHKSGSRRNRGPSNGAGTRRRGALASAGQNGDDEKAILITGGAGFIGTNLAHRLLSAGKSVLIYDNLSRPGVAQNLQWLRQTHGELVQVEQADVRDYARLQKAVARACKVFHFAAQVAVTTSLVDPIEDFEINARGTLNLLEALRAQDNPPPLLFTSTNKVYGDLKEVKLRTRRERYEPEDDQIRQHGFGEDRPVNFHSPYGCSKGAACQYVQDYARTFGLRTAVFRMSCIYGPHQFGTEDQGWVAHFLIKALENAPITLYGDGRQVRDILFVEDLVNALLLAHEKIDAISGRAFNIGGGPANTTSLLELVDLIAELHGDRPQLRFDEWRAADQLYYVSDTRLFSRLTGWTPRIDVRVGVAKLFHWLLEYHRSRSEAILALPEIATSGNGHARRGGSPAATRNRAVIKLRPARIAHGSRRRSAVRLLKVG